MRWKGREKMGRRADGEMSVAPPSSSGCETSPTASRVSLRGWLRWTTWRTTALGVVVLATGCFGHTQRQEAAFPGSVDAAPAISALPSTDCEPEALSESMRFGWLLADESLGLPQPAMPPSREMHALKQWTSDVLKPWLERKSRTVEAARKELDEAAETSLRERIMAGALVGILYEDVALTLRRVPMPQGLENEPEIAAMYQDVIDFQASPFVEHARRAYYACAQNAINRGPMHHWSAFCSGRVDRLPASRMPEEEGTTVTVVAASE